MPLSHLAEELRSYTEKLDTKALHSEFFDLETAHRTAILCQKLLAALPNRPSKAQHQLVQVAIKYFVLEDDAEDDNNSLIGFDDDLKVVVAVTEELGWDHLLEDGPTNG